MPYRDEVRREVWKVTEWREGQVYKTESLGLIWVPILDFVNLTFEDRLAWEHMIAKEHGGDSLSSVSSTLPYEETFRSVKVQEGGEHAR
jgi:hypothetical protein